jgi:tetratricopeptide (TPR) repeat protein
MADPPLGLARALADRYQLERELGHGGMAIVYLARDHQHDRSVALKVLRPELAAALGTERFLREIHIAAQLAHPHILPLHDSGAAAEFLYYVMPFVEGESLRDRLDRDGQLPIEDAVAIASEVADALGYAHSRGIVHRDIKPENILLAGDHALVADFGIARALAAAGGEKLTETGIAVGTPAYMSPEQWSGDARLDGRADLYALGCMVYEMLVGAPPFTGPSAQAIMARHSMDPVPPLRTVRRAVPAHIEAAILKALEKSPADRFATAGQFAAALTAPGRSVAKKRARRLAIAAGITVGLAGFTAAGLLWSSYTGRPGTLIGDGALVRGDRVVLGDFANHTDDTTIAAAVGEDLRVTLNDPRLVRLVDPMQVRQALVRMARPAGTPLDDSTSREVAERTNAKAFVTGEITRLGAGFQLTARISALDGSVLRSERVTARGESDLIAAVDRLGATLRRDIGESLRAALMRPPLYQATTASLPALRALSAAVRAEYLGGGGDPVALARRAVELDTGFATGYLQLFAILSAHGYGAEATDAIEQAYRRRARLPEAERLHIELGYYFSLNAYDLTKAEAVLQQMLDLDPRSTLALQNLAFVRNGQRRFAEAESLARRAMDLDIENGGSVGRVALSNALAAQLAQGRLQAADSLVTRSPPGIMPQAGLTVALAKRDWEGARAWADSAVLGPDARERLRALLNVVHGRLGAAERVWGARPPGWAMLAVLRYTGDTARALRTLARWRDAVGWDTTPGAGRNYAIPIVVNAEAGRVRQARELLGEWQRVPDNRSGSSALAWDEPWAIGAIALADGRTDSAVAAFLAWNRAPPPDRVQNQGFVEAAMALDRAGRADSSVVLYERALAVRALGGRYYEVSWYPLVLYRLGELHQSLGHWALARDYFSRFVDLWKDADPELQPRVRQAREHLAEAVAHEGGT